MTVFYLDGFALSFLVKTKKGSQARLVTRKKMAMDCHGYYEQERQQSTHHLQSHFIYLTKMQQYKNYLIIIFQIRRFLSFLTFD